MISGFLWIKYLNSLRGRFTGLTSRTSLLFIFKGHDLDHPVLFSLAVALAEIVGDRNRSYMDSATRGANFILNELYYKKGVFNNYIRAEKGCQRGLTNSLSLSDAGVSMHSLSSFALVSRNTSFTDM